jgi:hypothetical protein
VPRVGRKFPGKFLGIAILKAPPPPGVKIVGGERGGDPFTFEKIYYNIFNDSGKHMVIWEVLSSEGNLICHCGWEGDAVALAGMVPGRTYRRMQRLAPEIIDVLPIEFGSLPGQIGLPSKGDPIEGGGEKVIAPGVGVPVGV